MSGGEGNMRKLITVLAIIGAVLAEESHDAL